MAHLIKCFLNATIFETTYLYIDLLVVGERSYTFFPGLLFTYFFSLLLIYGGLGYWGWGLELAFWGPNRVFGKTEDHGFLSVKKMKTLFLAKWRNEDWRFI